MPDKNTTIHIYTDGSVLKTNPSTVGGWAALLVYNESEKMISGVVGSTQESPTITNNAMELAAIYYGLAAIKNPRQPIVVHSDSMYAISSLNGTYSRIYKTDPLTKNKVLCKKDGTPVANGDWIVEILKLIQTKNMTVDYKHVRGHSKHIQNERVHAEAYNKCKEWEVVNE